MKNLPEDIITLIMPFAIMFSNRIWVRIQLLLIGTILCRGQHTVAAILRVMDLYEEKGFGNYHRVLNRAKWSALQGSKILLGLLIVLVPLNLPVIVGIDETIERRKGEKIKAKGCYRDAVLSTEKHVVKCLGLKWISMMLIVLLPWSSRYWALPFLTILAPSKRANEKEGKRHKTTVDWAIQMALQVKRWLSNREIVLIGDGGYSAVKLALKCIRNNIILISRLRLDARLYDFPGSGEPGKRGQKPGPKPLKGKKLTQLKTLIEDNEQNWQEQSINWYGQSIKTIRFLTGFCLWHTPGEKPVPIRWVLVADPDNKCKPEAFFSTNLNILPAQIVEWFVLRWNVEVTFEESRRHLGIETQRQWSDKAIARTTPALFALFSIVCLMAVSLLHGEKLNPISTAWYKKQDVTFSDVLTFVRRHIWQAKYLNKFNINSDITKFNLEKWQGLIEHLASAA
jgi:hypothetical protein